MKTYTELKTEFQVLENDLNIQLRMRLHETKGIEFSGEGMPKVSDSDLCNPMKIESISSKGLCTIDYIVGCPSYQVEDLPFNDKLELLRLVENKKIMNS